MEVAGCLRPVRIPIPWGLSDPGRVGGETCEEEATKAKCDLTGKSSLGFLLEILDHEPPR